MRVIWLEGLVLVAQRNVPPARGAVATNRRRPPVSTVCRHRHYWRGSSRFPPLSVLSQVSQGQSSRVQSSSYHWWWLGKEGVLKWLGVR